MRRFKKLWRAIVQWWKDEDPPPPNRKVMKSARKLLEQYDDLYGRRIGITDYKLRDQATSIVVHEDHQRPVSLENEVRVLAIATNQILRHLEEEDERASVLRRNR